MTDKTTRWVRRVMSGGKLLFVIEFAGRIRGWQLYCTLGPGTHKLEVLGYGTIEVEEYTSIYIPDPKEQSLPYI